MSLAPPHITPEDPRVREEGPGAQPSPHSASAAFIIIPGFCHPGTPPRMILEDLLMVLSCLSLHSVWKVTHRTTRVPTRVSCGSDAEKVVVGNGQGNLLGEFLLLPVLLSGSFVPLGGGGKCLISLPELHLPVAFSFLFPASSHLTPQA